MGNKAKLILKGISEESGQPFKREIRTLDEVRESGQYTLVGYNVSEDEGLPPAEYDECNYCFIEALLSVTRNSSTSGYVQKETIGQTITISNREDGGTNIYNRSWSKGKNDELWTPWLMIATGNMQLIAQNNDVVKAYTEVSENLYATLERIEKAEDSISKNNEKVLEYATVRFDRVEENITIINAGEADSVKEVVYYKPSNIFVAVDSSGTYWDTWKGRDAYMRDNAIYENKLYICGNQSYIWDGAMLCDVSEKVITLLQAEISRANKAEQLILQLMNNIKPVEYSGTVFNSPDEEDITELDNALKLKDRPWGDGMGYVILRKNKPLQEQFTEENTIYEVRYDFDLNGEEITIPENCTLNFNGGSITDCGILLQKECNIYGGKIIVGHEKCIKLMGDNNIKDSVFSTKTYCTPGLGVIYADKVNNIHIDNCIFTPQQEQSLGKCSSIDLRQCNNFKINAIKSYYTEGENIIIYEGIGVVSNSYLERGWSGIGTSVYGASLGTSVPPADNSLICITNNIVYNSIAAGITINNKNVYCYNNSIFFNGITTGGPCIRLGHDFAKAEQCIVKNNTIKWNNVTVGTVSSSDRGISIDYGNNNVIDGNTIIGVKTAINSSVSSKCNTTIKNNEITDCSVGIVVYEPENSVSVFNIYSNNINVADIGLWSHYASINAIDNKITVHNDSDSGIATRIESHTDNYLLFNSNYMRADKIFAWSSPANNVNYTQNTLISATKEELQCNFNKMDLIGNNVKDCIFRPSKISLIKDNFFDCHAQALYIDKCEKIDIINNTFINDSAAYAIWVNVSDVSNVQYIRIHNNTTNSLSGTVNGNLFTQLKNKIKFGFDCYSNPRFISDKGLVNFDNETYHNKINYINPELKNTDGGASVFNTTLGKPVWWTGSKWVHATGTEV